MKKLFRLSGILLTFLICLTCLLPGARAAYAGYDITAYDIIINIGEDNVYHVTETITADFHVPSRGIYRYIPLRQEMEWKTEDNTKRVIYNTKIDSVSVQDFPFDTYIDNGNMVIKVGDPNKFNTGKVVYDISYDHALGDDKIDEGDFVYYNLIGTYWDCSISGISFTVTMPKDFDGDSLRFFSGAFGSAGNAPVEYSTSDNMITGELAKTLRPGEGLTMQLDLPEGYFDAPPEFPWQAVFIAASLALVLAALILFLLFGRDRALPRPVEFYPPDGVTPAEAAYIISGSVDNKDVVSLVIYWASKGFISIEQTGKNDFKLVKLKDLTDNTHEYEKTLFFAIFNGRQSVLISKLRENIYNEVESVKLQIPPLYSGKGKRLYTLLSLYMGILSLFSVWLLVMASLFIALYRLFYSAQTALIYSFVGAFIIMLPIRSLSQSLSKWHGKGRGKRTALLTGSLIGSVVLLSAYAAFMYSQGLFLGSIFISGAVLFLGIISVYMRKRTKRGSDLLGRILGFKNFLEVAEKERLELLSQDNPSYFYDILPYAYVFGVSEKWAKKFEELAVRPPSWYTGYSGAFTPLLFNLLIFNSLATMHSAMTARPVTARSGFGGGGGFGGMGFSGGGFGGGGGGRW